MKWSSRIGQKCFITLSLSNKQCQKQVATVTFTVRTLLEENPNLVCLKLDVKNAQNSISRARCVKVLEAIPELRHLAWHAATVLAPVTTLHANGERLFHLPGAWGEMEQVIAM